MNSNPVISRARHRRRALTLVELMVVITILALLVALFLGIYKSQIAKAESVDAITKLKSMHAALSNYLVDKQTWPQEPEDDSLGGDDDLWEWWKKELEPYGMGERDWYTTSHLRRLNRQFKESGGRSVGMDAMGREEDLKFPSIMPGSFDPGPTEPYRYQNQPWVTETGEYHGDEGIYTIMPGGNIHKMMTTSKMNKAQGKQPGGK